MAAPYAPAPMPTYVAPTLPPMPSLPTYGEILTTLAPVLATLAPGVSEAASDAATNVLRKATNATSTALKNVTQKAKEHLSSESSPKVVSDKPGTIAKPSDGPSMIELVRPFVIPILGLTIGGVMMQYPRVAMYGKLVLYFGAQSFMNIFMSWLSGTHVIISAGTQLESGKILEKDLKGCPAGFALTALQQVVSFIVFLVYFGYKSTTSTPYVLKELKTYKEYASVFVFGCVFAANISLNNVSLGYISMGVNLIIRSCLPLSTYLSQQVMSMWGLYQKKPFKILEVTLMVVGVICAFIFTWADFRGKFVLGGRFIGVLACLGSLICGSLNLALAGVLGDTKFNVLDTCAYMAIPATLFLTPLVFLAKPVPPQWAIFQPSMTDWQILVTTWHYSKSTIGWFVFSGVLSFMYNICQFNIVHTLSPSATAFGGNFNKAALTFMTLLLPFLQTKPNPPMPYIAFEWLALLVNICAFSFYSYLQIQAKREQQQPHNKLTESEEESEEEDSSDE